MEEGPGERAVPDAPPLAPGRARAGPLVAWIPQAYVWTPAITGAAGLGLLVRAATRRPGAWVLASTLMWVSLAFSGAIMAINQCD